MRVLRSDAAVYVYRLASIGLGLADLIRDTDPELANELVSSSRFFLEKLESESYGYEYMDSTFIKKVIDKFSRCIIEYSREDRFRASAIVHSLVPSIPFARIVECSDCVAEISRYSGYSYELRYNSVLFSMLPEEDRVFILLHEVFHAADGHDEVMYCIKSVTLWNLACDLYVNEVLLNRAGLRPRVITPFITSVRTLNALSKRFCSTEIKHSSDKIIEARIFPNYVLIDSLYRRCREIAMLSALIPGRDLKVLKTRFVSLTCVQEYPEISEAIQKLYTIETLSREERS